MKKLLLVNPEQKHSIGGNLPSYVDGNRGCLPPLGLLYLATAIELWSKEWIAEIADLPAGDRLENFQPDVVGITATTFTLLDAIEVAQQAKRLWNVPVIIGGIHPTIYPSETANLPNIDYVFTGEGEKTLPNCIEHILNGTAPKIINSEDFLDVLSLSPPMRSLLNTDRYYSVLGTKSKSTTMITSRGCPFNCLFCHRKTMGRRWRARTAKQVVDEMKMITDLEIGEVLIYDDTFTVDRFRVEEICWRIKREGIKLSFDIRARVDTVSQDLVDALGEAGCKRIHYGIEASSNRVLKSIGKGITIEQARRAIEITRNAGIESLAYFIFGSPGEGWENVEETIAFAKELSPNYCHFAIMTPYPATPLYEMGLMKGLYNDYWADFARNPREDFVAPFWPELGRDYLLSAINRAYKSFYMRPKFIAQEIIKTRSIDGLRKKAQGALSMAFGGKA